MSEPAVSFGQLSSVARRFARRLLSIAENRLELLSVEVQEDRERLLHVFFLGLGAAAFGLLAAITLTAVIVVWLWDYSHTGALLVLTALYGLAAVWLGRRLSSVLHVRRSSFVSLDQLRKDRECLEKILE